MIDGALDKRGLIKSKSKKASACRINKESFIISLKIINVMFYK